MTLVMVARSLSVSWSRSARRASTWLLGAVDCFGASVVRAAGGEVGQEVRMIRTLRVELGTDHGTIQRVATQLGYSPESVRSWVRQADIDEGHQPGLSTTDAERLKALDQENRELKRAHEMARRSSLTSRSSAAIRCASAEVTPGR